MSERGPLYNKKASGTRNIWEHSRSREVKIDVETLEGKKVCTKSGIKGANGENLLDGGGGESRADSSALLFFLVKETSSHPFGRSTI